MSEGVARRSRRHGGGESYFVSLNDLLVGMLFIFIILLMAFALSYKAAEIEAERTIEHLKDALGQSTQARTDLLDELERRLLSEGIDVVIDRENGVLRLPEGVLFASGSADLGVRGQHALRVLANALSDLLPCYTERSRRASCPAGSAPILEAVYVEGHTDNVPIRTAIYDDNWDLSSTRAIRTYRFMLEAAGTLKEIRNAGDTATLFGASAYADQRPISADSNSTGAGRERNRRIDLRFLLAPPTKLEAIPPSVTKGGR